MMIDQSGFAGPTEICELNEGELSMVSGGPGPVVYYGIRIAAAVVTIGALAAYDYFSEDEE